MAKTLALVSLGCAKNAVDLQLLAGKLLAGGEYVLSPDQDRADVVIVNTCAFIQASRDEAEQEIVRAIQLKQNGNYGFVAVAGCYPQRYPEAKAKFPGVDSWQGVPEKWERQQVPGLRFTGKAFAYLKIAEGCSHKCAYCAIPAIRGKFRSRPVKDVLEEAKALVSTGCRELNIVAQDPMLYRSVYGGRTVKLVDLLKLIDEIPGEFWVRVLYSYPNEITPGFIDWLCNSPHAVKYVDVPLQHTVPAVLERMNRSAAIEASLAAAEKLRAAIPGVTLRTTIMTGFPGETEKRFAQLLADIRRMGFDHLGAFAFSPEEGTAAAEMKSRPPRKIAEERERKVMKTAAQIWRTKARAMLGNTYPALIVAPGVARMPSQAPDVDGVVFVDGGEPGCFANVRLVSARGFDFEGEIV